MKDHHEIAALLDRIEALIALQPLDAASGRELERLAIDYSHALWRHIDAENSVLFPDGREVKYGADAVKQAYAAAGRGAGTKGLARGSVALWLVRRARTERPTGVAACTAAEPRASDASPEAYPPVAPVPSSTPADVTVASERTRSAPAWTSPTPV